jgi:hypothetical protein
VHSLEFFQDLLSLAQQDLSQAHLRQHFAAARGYVTAFGLSMDGDGAWSAAKPQDTLVYTDGTVSGKKYWVSGLDSCNWAVVPVKNNNDLALVVLQKEHLTMSPILTQGMENTRTVHFTCEQAPAVILGPRNDARAWDTDKFHRWCFVTNHLGIALAVFNDIDLYTKHTAIFDYNKEKLKLDLEILHLLWSNGIADLNTQSWQRNNTVYAFAKKVVTQVAQLTTEITGSGLFEIDHSSHQRYQDILIYSTHMRNTATAIKDIQYWSF